MSKKTETTSLRLTEEAKRLLKLLMAQEDRSGAYIIEKLIQEEAKRRNLK